VEYGYFPSVITVYFSANCVHFSRLTVLIGGKFSIYYPYSMQKFPSKFILRY
jgi:hypothetical protein